QAYWRHTLAEEGAGYSTVATESAFRIDMHDCPSKGFLIRNGLEQYHDYCDHCIGWIRPLLEEAGFGVDHEHNHRGTCWWEMRRAEDRSGPSACGALSGQQDVRLREDWEEGSAAIDRFGREEQGSR